MINKKRVTFFLPQRLHEDLMETLLMNDYSTRDKSRWIAEAIEKLFKVKNFIDLVAFSDDMEGLSKKETATIPEKLKIELSNKTKLIKSKHLDMDGVQSKIIRTAILQGILRSNSPGGKIA